MGKSKKSLKSRFLNHLTRVGIAALSLVFIQTPVSAVEPLDAVQEVSGSEGAKEALNEALKVARSKPALSVAGVIVCGACLPVAGAAASPALCVACGILIAKVVG